METTKELTSWIADNWLLLVVVGGLLILAYAYSGPIVDRLVRRTLKATEGDFSGEGVEDVELQKRSATITSLFTTLIRLSIISIVLLVFVGLTGSEWILVIIGLFVAGMAIAGQAIVLDYLMGVLILIEGQFFQGDNIELGTMPWKGTVESVGLRRTVVRAVDGTVFSISNGEIRSVANRTRIYAAAEVRVRGIRQGDLNEVKSIMATVGQEVAEDPDFSEAIIEAPKLAFIDDPDDLGNVAVMRGKVVAAERWRVSTEVRLRLDEQLKASGVELNRLALRERA